MGEIRWIILSAIAVLAVNAAPRELNSEELITEPRPGEEYVNIQTGGPPSSPHKVDLQGNSFTTSHRISQPKPKFETAHKIKSERDALETAASDIELIYDEIETTTSDVPVEIVTRTSVKMSKSKKVQKPVAKDVKLDIKSTEGVIDERKNADEEERKIMTKKFSTENPKPSTKILKFNVPFEEDETETTKPTHTATTPDVTTTAPTTTEEPQITTFNYKNIYDKSKKKEVIEIIPENNEKIKQEKFKYETVANEALKTAESRNNKKDTKQEKKHHEIQRKEDVGFEVVPVNKSERKLKEDNFDFFDADEKVLVPAGSSPGQSSRINIKKGPNGQDYEYEYVYYYYDEDEDNVNGTVNLKEGKVVQTTTTERVYNGHDGPSAEAKQSVQTSTNGNKYLPTDAPKTTQRSRTKVEYDEVEYEEEDEKELTHTRGGSNSNRYTNINRNNEHVNNEVLPATTRATPRTRGRISIPGAVPVPIEDIPAIADERLPANTRFPPRSRSNNVVTSPQPVETTSRSRTRENTQTRGRTPISSVDSTVYRTQSSESSSEEDPIYETELQRRPPTRQQTTTEAKYEEIPRRGTRPTTVSTTEEITSQENIPSRRPISRRPDDRTRQKVYEDEEEKPERIIGNSRRPDTTRESDSEEAIFEVTKTPYSSIQRPSTEVKSNDITTENQSVGLTSASMEKVAFDLYAILQQAHNENIRTNLVENATDSTTDAEEASTEFSTTTTTTTTEQTTTSTTTTTPAPAVTQRGRYKSRGGSGVNISNPSKARTRQPSGTSSTTEPATESSSPKTRGRFHPTHANRASNHIPSRRPTTPKVEETQEDSAVKEEVTKQSAEKTFGDRPSRNKYRTSGRTPTSTTTSAPSGTAAPAAAGSRSSSLDRYNSRRRGSRPTSTTQQPSNEEVSAEEKQDEHQGSKVTEDTTSAKPRTRPPTSAARPLRPGVRVPLFPRGRSTTTTTTTTTTPAPVEAEDVEKEAPTAEEQHVPQVVEEVQEQPTTQVTTTNRLKNRPRVRYNPSSPLPRPQSTPISNRRSLINPPRRKAVPEEKPIEKLEEVIEDDKTQEELDHEEEVASPSTEASSTTAEPENKGLSGLVPGRRRPNRKLPTFYRKQTTEAP